MGLFKRGLPSSGYEIQPGPGSVFETRLASTLHQSCRFMLEHVAHLTDHPPGTSYSCLVNEDQIESKNEAAGL